MEPRIELLEGEEARRRAEASGVPVPFADLSIFRILLRQPTVARPLADLLLHLLGGTHLPHRLRELVIMRIGWATGSDYEWTQHWQIGREWFGCDDADFLAVRDWQRSDHFDEADRAVLAATDETLATGAMSDATWQECRRQLDDDACLELTCTISLWRLVSEVARTIQVPLEEGVASWPPDGEAPPASAE